MREASVAAMAGRVTWKQSSLFLCAALALSAWSASARADVVTGAFGVAEFTEMNGNCVADYQSASGGSVQGSAFFNCTNNAPAPAGLTSASVSGGSHFANEGLPNSASGSASADLRSGSLHEKLFCSGAGEAAGCLSRADGLMWDTLTFHVPHGTAASVTTIGVIYQVHGNLSATDGCVNATNSDCENHIANLNLDVGGLPSGGTNACASCAQWGWDRGTEVGCFPSSCPGFPFKVLTDNINEWRVKATVQLDGANPILGIAAEMELRQIAIFGPGSNPAFGTQTDDFSNTASLSLVLPDGVTFSSASGQFLTPTGVPEPASLALFGAGVLGFRLLRRRNAI